MLRERERGWAPRTVGVLVVLIWSSCFVAIKGTSGDAPPVLYGALRASISAICLLAVAAATGRLLPPRRAWFWLLSLGLTNTTLGLAGMFLSVGLAGATIPSVLVNSQALLVAPLAAWLFSERLTTRCMIGLAVGVVGVSLTTLAGSNGMNNASAIGVLFGLLAAAGLGVGNLIIKHLAATVEPLTAVAWQYAIGAAGLLLWSAVTEAPVEVRWSPRLIFGLAYLGLIGSAGASWLWYRLLKTESLVSLNALTLLSPALSVLLAWILFREVVVAAGWIGIILSLVGVTLVSLPARAQEALPVDRSAQGTEKL